MKHMLTEEQESKLLNNCKEIRRSVPYIARGQEYICKARKGEKQTMKRETIDKFLYHKVTLTDCNGMVMSGYFVPHAKKYKLFPENSGWDTYVYRPSHIRKLETTSKAKQQPSIRPMPKKKGNKKVGKELLEKASKVKSVGNTMGQFDIYLDEFIEKEKQ